MIICLFVFVETTFGGFIHAGGVNQSSHQALAQNTTHQTLSQMSTHLQLPPHPDGGRSPPPLFHVQHCNLDYTEGGGLNPSRRASASESEHSVQTTTAASAGHSTSTPNSEAAWRYNTPESPSKYGPGNFTGYNTGEMGWGGTGLSGPAHTGFCAAPSAPDTEIGIQILGSFLDSDFT